MLTMPNENIDQAVQRTENAEPIYQTVNEPAAGAYSDAPAAGAADTANDADSECEAQSQCGADIQPQFNGIFDGPAPGSAPQFAPPPPGPGFPPPPPPPAPKLAGFFTRLAAFAVDTIACAVIGMTVSAPLAFIDLFAGSGLSSNWIFKYSVIDILVYVVTVAYFIVFTYFWDATPGKKLLNIKVISVPGEEKGNRFLDILFRESVGRFLSSLLCIGYIVGGLDRKKRCFHDMLADTRVVYDL